METTKLPKGIIRKKGKYQVKYLGRCQYNKKMYYTKIADTVEDAEILLKELKKNLVDGLQEDINRKKGKIKLDDFYKIWLKQYKELTIKESSLENYMQIYTNHIKEPFGDKYLNEITIKDVQIFVNRLAQSSLSGSTVQKIYIVLSNMLKQAYKCEYIRKNISTYITIPKLKKSKKRNIMSLECEKLFLDYTQNELFKKMYIVALYTGMRANEITALRWEDIDLDRKIINVKHTLVMKSKDNYYLSSPKTRTSVRSIPMLSKVRNIFIELYNSEGNRTNSDETFVFNTDGIPISLNSLNVHMDATIKRMQKDNIDIKHMTMHCLRHTFATRCAQQGIKPNTLKNLLGHAKITITMDLYAHVEEEEKRKELNRLENIM